MLDPEIHNIKDGWRLMLDPEIHNIKDRWRSILDPEIHNIKYSRDQCLILRFTTQKIDGD